MELLLVFRRTPPSVPPLLPPHPPGLAGYQRAAVHTHVELKASTSEKRETQMEAGGKRRWRRYGADLARRVKEQVKV